MILARAAIRNSRIFQHQPAAFAVRGMADVEVEHGRGQWQTYGDLESYKQGKYQIKTFNKISPIGLARFPNGEYDVRPADSEAANAHAILLRSHKLQEEDVPNTVRAIAR
jgi:D-3-phosphoglycerate dehydrogenase